MVAALSFSDDNAIRYVLPVLWMTSYFHLMERMDQNQKQCHVSSSSPGGGTGGVAIYDCRLVYVRRMLALFISIFLYLLRLSTGWCNGII